MGSRDRNEIQVSKFVFLDMTKFGKKFWECNNQFISWIILVMVNFRMKFPKGQEKWK